MADMQEYKCLSCGGGLEFNSAVQKMKCPFCDTEFEMSALKAYDEETKTAGASDMKWDVQSSGEWGAGELDGMSVYGCQSCGGEIVGDATTAATKCPYCDNPVVMKGQFSGALKPDYVIPFKLDKKAAENALSNHFKGKKLLPRVFSSQHHIEEIQGLYVPFWLFDTDADATVRYKALKKKKWSDDKFNYVETSSYSVLRQGTLGFTKVPVDGSTKMPDALMESVEPYDYKDVKEFQSAYLAGYVADKYDVDAEASIARANERVTKSVESSFKKTVTGYDSVTPEHTAVSLKGGKVSYALLPLWLLNTNWNSEKFVFAMNGQTGKIVGNLPMDKSAFWKYFMMWFCGGAVGAVVLQILYGLIANGSVSLTVPGIVGAAVIGLLLSFFVTSGMKGQLKTVGMQARADSYEKANSLKMRTNRDTFLFTKVEKTPKPQASTASASATDTSTATAKPATKPATPVKPPAQVAKPGARPGQTPSQKK